MVEQKIMGNSHLLKKKNAESAKGETIEKKSDYYRYTYGIFSYAFRL